jgi:hypothetical protein
MIDRPQKTPLEKTLEQIKPGTGVAYERPPPPAEQKAEARTEELRDWAVAIEDELPALLRSVADALAKAEQELDKAWADLAIEEEASADLQESVKALLARERELVEATGDLYSWLENAGMWQPDDPEFAAAVRRFRAAYSIALQATQEADRAERKVETRRSLHPELWSSAAKGIGREGMLTVWDDQGGYVGCLGIETWKAMLDVGEQEAEALRLDDQIEKIHRHVHEENWITLEEGKTLLAALAKAEQERHDAIADCVTAEANARAALDRAEAAELYSEHLARRERKLREALERIIVDIESQNLDSLSRVLSALRRILQTTQEEKL